MLSLTAVLYFATFACTAADEPPLCLIQRDAKSFRAQPTRDTLVGRATPSSPSRKITPEDWKSAAKERFFPLAERRAGVKETLFAKALTDGEPPKCGTPCVAHCIAGQPRDLINSRGLWKSIKHRLFDQFSENPVIFALLAVGKEVMEKGGEEGAEGYVRQQQEGVTLEEVQPSLEFLGVDRALLLQEACTTGSCLQQGLRLKCDAKQLQLTTMFDKNTGQYTNMCEIQVSRFRDALELVRDYEDEHQMKFDWVTRPRPDVYFTRPAPLARTLELDSVHVSPWAQCGYGGMDWFYAVPRKFADTIGNFANDVACSDFNSDPEIPKTCVNCAGCECWMAAWMYKNKIPFKKLPWAWFTPAKFCGADCPGDWEVTPENIMGMDSRTKTLPCTRDGDGVRCPMLLSINQTLRNQSGVMTERHQF